MCCMHYKSAIIVFKFRVGHNRINIFRYMTDFQSESFISHITVNGLKYTKDKKKRNSIDLIDFVAIFMSTAFNILHKLNM